MENSRPASPVNWFPGHMAKARRLIEENIRLVDVVAELADARIPATGRNPELDHLIPGDKPRILLLNKADLAHPAANEAWLAHYRGAGLHSMLCDSKSQSSAKAFVLLVKRAAAAILERREQRKTSGMALRVMVVGIPNVGKSTLINTLAGSKRARTEDRPGVTRGKQWISIGAGLELLDMPGLLWPKIETERQGLLLAFTGAVRDDILDMEHIAASLLKELADMAPQALSSRYRLQGLPDKSGAELLNDTGRSRGFLLPGGVVDTERAARMVLDEYRAAKIGRFTLDSPPGREQEGP